MQDQSSLQFENNVIRIFERMFKNKLTGKAFAIRIAALMGIGFILSILITTYTASLAYSPSPISSSITLLAPLMTIFTSIGLIITTSLVIRRVKDIVYDLVLWPYALGAVVLSLIPFLGCIVLIALVIVPSGYLTQEKQRQLLQKLS